MKNKLITASMVFMLLVPLVFGACGSNQEGFAIYLTKENIPVDKISIMSHVEIADSPLISLKDIKSYAWDKQEIELTPEAFQRIRALKVPTNGTIFIVCLNKQITYPGALWTPVSSQSYNGITIMVPPFPLNKLPPNTIKIDTGYPSSSFFQGNDLRFNAEIKDALSKAGKLK